MKRPQSPLNQRASGRENPCLRVRSSAGGSSRRASRRESDLALGRGRAETIRHASEREIDQPWIQKRRAHLERTQHARAIDLDEDVVDEIRLKINRRALTEGAVTGPAGDAL